MKRKSCSPCDSLVSLFDDDELEVSKILFDIPRIIFQSENRNRLLVAWGVRKRRSAIDPDLYPPSVPSSSSPHLPRTCVGPTCDDDDPPAKVEPSSPATPLSFSPSESDGKSKRSKKSVSSKKKKENLFKMVEDLTHQKESLKTETLGPELVASLDLNLSIALNADTTQLNRAAAAQARKKRLQIYKVKNPKGGSSPSILSLG
uniref:Uncharacterized protein n=1 Tax=Vitis vinifera TaxID=29760 RepID=F6GZU3_VITVI